MRLVSILARWLLAGVLVGPGVAAAATPWPEWNAFAARFVQADGRVIDLTFDAKSTSEGQSYGLFFALVAGERARFDSVLAWTSDNLAGGRLGERLPAWHWGRRENGSWGVKDANAASDADLWLAYTLLEAGRLWNEPRYAQTGRELLAQVRRQEVVQAGAAGPLLLPGPVGFVLDKGRWRMNPSYLPGFMFRYFAAVDPQGPWQAVWDGYLRMAPAIFAAGVAPDNIVVDAAGRPLPDTEGTPTGSYDAIRVYLWAGLSAPADTALLRRLEPYAALTRKLGVPPEKVDPASGRPTKADYSPIGFSGALLPFLAALPDAAALESQRERVRAAAKAGGTTHYYDQALNLFGQGWLDGRYRFDPQGRLQPAWSR